MDDIRTVTCRGCGKTDTIQGKPSWHEWWRTDAYDIPTGHYCDDCYNSSRYPYKKDRYYNYLDAGEYLESEDY